MKKTQEHLLGLLTLVIHGGVPTQESFSSINGTELLTLAIQQNISSVLYPTLYKHREIIKLDEKIMRRWKEITLFVAIRQVRMMNEIKTIFKLYSSNSLPALSLKGLVLKQLYSQPELRNMGDLDLLIDEKDMQRAIGLMKTLGYYPNPENLNDPTHMHIEMLKRGSCSVDLHRTLWPPRNMKKRDNQIWFDHIWKNMRLIEMEGLKFNGLSLEDELINLVIHLAKHLMYSGANLLQLCDIVLFLKAYWNILDLNYIDQTLREMDLFIFYQYLLTTCHLYFGLAIPVTSGFLQNSNSEVLIKDFFNFEINSHTTDESESWRIISARYAFSRNNRFLIPLAFVIEVGRQFVKKRKGFLYSISYSKNSIKAFSNRTRFLRSIGLLVRL